MEENIQKPNAGLNYYRIKTEWVAEGDKGALEKTKTEELVLATSYSEAETVAYAIAEDQNRGKFGSFSIEIVKTKIEDVLFNEILSQDDKPLNSLICNFFEEGEESGVGLYAVKVIFFNLDEKSGKTKRVTQTYFVPATSNSDATRRIDSFLKGTLSDYVIRDTKFDKAAAIYWPADVHQSKVNAADKC